MKKFSLLFVFTCVSVNVFAVEQTIKKDSPLFVPKCEDANFQYPRCIDSNGKVIDNPKFIEYGKNNPGRRGVSKTPRVSVE
ncbi:MAG: hypothetical protein Q8L85_02220 [Alphaproteobacteria bacterium]|nr:hypothetical protein [Alphaproteobacteria bacterium]